MHIDDAYCEVKSLHANDNLLSHGHVHLPLKQWWTTSSGGENPQRKIDLQQGEPFVQTLQPGKCEHGKDIWIFKKIICWLLRLLQNTLLLSIALSVLH